MANGGGPACLRLRVQCDPAEVDPRFLVEPAKLDRIEAVVASYWPEQIHTAEIQSAAVVTAVEGARRALVESLDLAELL